MAIYGALAGLAILATQNVPTFIVTRYAMKEGYPKEQIEEVLKPYKPLDAITGERTTDGYSFVPPKIGRVHV